MIAPDKPGYYWLHSKKYGCQLLIEVTERGLPGQMWDIYLPGKQYTYSWEHIVEVFDPKKIERFADSPAHKWHWDI